MDDSLIQEELETAKWIIENKGFLEEEKRNLFFIPVDIFDELCELYYDCKTHYNERDDSLEKQSKSRKSTIISVDSFNLRGIESIFSKKEPLKMLDAGSAEGDRTLKYKDKLEEKSYAVDVYCLDLSPVKCQKAQKNFKSNVVNGNMRDIPFQDDYFDIVLNLSGSIGHLSPKDMHKAMLEYYRVLKVGGVLCMDFLGIDIKIEIEESNFSIGKMDGRSASDDIYRPYMVYKSPGMKLGIVYRFKEEEIKDLIKTNKLNLVKFGVLNKKGSEPMYMTFSVK